MDRKSLATYILIGSLVMVFGMFGIWKFTDPLIWTGFMPSWIDGLLGLDKINWLSIVGTIELLIALALLIPFTKIRKPAVVIAILHLAGVITQVGWNDVGVRDIAILLSAIALFLLLEKPAH